MRKASGAAAAAFLCLLGVYGHAEAETVSILYAFPGGSGLGFPQGPITIDPSGNIFGTAYSGSGDDGVLAVYEASPPAAGQTSWIARTLYSFPAGEGDGSASGVIRDGRDNLYGTTVPDVKGCGRVYKLLKVDSTWHYSLLWKFADDDGPQGCYPMALTPPSDGKLFGVTSRGGTNDGGTVFELFPPSSPGEAWTESVIWNFDPAVDGSSPVSPMRRDAAGNLYGTSELGGPNGAGTVWKLSPPQAGSSAWTRQVLWGFSGPDGRFPLGKIVIDSQGALYGSCYEGGDGTHQGFGVIFKLTPPSAGGGSVWSEATLWSLDGTLQRGGREPTGVDLTPQGNLVFDTFVSGRVSQLDQPAPGQSSWTLHFLADPPGVAGVLATPVLAAQGVITGTSAGSNGGSDNGQIWRVTR